MAAGLGFKTFTTGEVLTAADTNGYLMQGVLVFASSAARASAVTSPQEGQYSYLKDTNSTEYYDGAAWIAAPIGDITGVTAGTGISGGGTSGTVTVTNSMATALTTSGDLIQATGAGTFARLGTGTNGQYLTTNGTTNSWGTVSAGGMTLINSTTFSGASSVSLNNVFSATYANYFVATNFTSSGSINQAVGMRLRVGGVDSTGADYVHDGNRSYPSAVIYYGGTTTSFGVNPISSVNANNASHVFHLISPYLVNRTGIHALGTGYDATYGTQGIVFGGSHGVVASYDGFTLFVASGNIAGTVRVYGYGN